VTRRELRKGYITAKRQLAAVLCCYRVSMCIVVFGGVFVAWLHRSYAIPNCAFATVMWLVVVGVICIHTGSVIASRLLARRLRIGCERCGRSAIDFRRLDDARRGLCFRCGHRSSST
jgi:hypothetical protein